VAGSIGPCHLDFGLLDYFQSGRLALLAKSYPARDAATLDGETWRFQSIQLCWATNYGNCVTVRTNSVGLGLSVLWLLRLGHPPLLIPWADITIHGLVEEVAFFHRWSSLGSDQSHRFCQD